MNLDDIHEFVQLRRDADAKKAAAAANLSSSAAVNMSKDDANTSKVKTRSETVRERIGFDPSPRVS